MPVSPPYRPDPRFVALGPDHADPVEPARFPKHILRYRVTPSRTDRARDAGALFLVLGVALALRLPRLLAAPFWFNEAYTGLQTFADPQRLLQAVRAEVTPPLYYLAIRAWAAILGHGEWSLRFFSVLAGTLAAGVVFGVARRVSRTAGTASGLLVAATPLFVHYSREARMYPMLVLLLAGAIACLVRAMEEGGGRTRAWAGTVVLGAASIATHYLAVLALAAAPVAALAWGRRAARNALLAAVAAVALALPLAPWVIEQARLPATGHVDRIWRAIPPVLAIPRSLELFMPGALYPPYPSFRMAPPPWRPAPWLLLAVVLLPALAACRSAPGIERRIARAGLAFLVVPLGLLSLVSLVRPVYLLGRYDLLALPGFALLAGVGIARLAPGVRVAIAGAAAILAATSLAPVYRPAPAQQSIARGVTARLLPALHDDDVLLFTGFGMPAVRYALLVHGRDPAFVTIPASTARHAGWVDLRRLRDPQGLREEVPRAARAAAKRAANGRIWLVEDLREPGGVEILRALQGMRFRPGLRMALSASVPGRWSQPLRATLMVREDSKRARTFRTRFATRRTSVISPLEKRRRLGYIP